MTDKEKILKLESKIKKLEDKMNKLNNIVKTIQNTYPLYPSREIDLDECPINIEPRRVGDFPPGPVISSTDSRSSTTDKHIGEY